MPEKKDAIYSQVKQLGVLTTIPILLLLGAVVGFTLGGWLDRTFKIYPWCTLILTGLALAAVGREITQLLKQILKDEEKNKK